ncbi:MAG: nucleoside-diphosphate sugar epimerase/dehydratase [Bacteroidales bacterium]
MIKRLISYFSSHYVNRFWILAIDTIAATVATLAVFWVMTYFTIRSVTTHSLVKMMLITLLVSLFSFAIFNTYKGVLRYTSIREMWRIIAAAIVKGLFIFLIMHFSYFSVEFNFSDPVLLISALADIIFTMFVLILIRLMITNVYSYFFRTNDKKTVRVLIYGLDYESVSLLGMLEKESDVIYKAEGFIHTNIHKKEKMLCGFPIREVSNKRDFDNIIFEYKVDAVIFPDHLSARKEKEYLVAMCLANDVKILIKPKLTTLRPGDSIATPIREIKIEDLLSRDQIKIDMDEINEYLTDKVVMVTGAAGSIGSQLCRELLTHPIQKLILLDNAETPMHNVYLEINKISPKIEKKFIIGDVRFKERMTGIFNKYHPNIIFHAAAYKHVPMMESNPCEAVNANVFGTMNLADLAVEYGVEKFVMISTDKAVNPANVMGATKRLAEIYVQSLSTAIRAGVVLGKTRFVTTRFGNVLGSNGSVIPLFRKQIKEGGPVTITDPNIIRYFMTIPEACRLVLEAGSIGEGDEIFVFDMGEQVKIIDLARNMIRLAGLKENEDISIKCVGLRPGEKLYEELLSNKETTIPTSHKKIRQAKVVKYIYKDVLDELKGLKIVANSMQKENTVSIMKKIIPEYKSCNSRYTKLDN